MAHANAPLYAVEKDQATLIQMHTGKAIKPLPASQTTVRGPHPPLTLLDEVDEMERAIYDAAIGQAMEQLNTHGELDRGVHRRLEPPGRTRRAPSPR